MSLLQQIFDFFNNDLYNKINELSGFLWSSLLVYVLVGTGIFFTFRLGFVQIRKFGTGMRKVFGGISLHGKKAGHDGMSSFQALSTAVAAQVGTGNLAGAATALILGGPGAIFWIWVSAFFGMATIYAEATLAQKTRITLENGRIVGGPVYYIKACFKGKFGQVLAAIFAILITLALGFMGNMVQSNSIGNAFKEVLPSVNPLIIGAIVAVIAAVVFFGGVRRIVYFTEKVVPLMCFFYLIGGIIILILNFSHIPQAFHDIFIGAFNPSAVVGGGAAIGVQQAIRYGVARGLFSNEAGMGSTPHAHALARVKHPTEQGYVAITGLFVDTFIILTMTTLVILVTGVLPQGFAGTLEGVALTQAAFETTFGFAGKVFIAITMLFFASSTIVGWYFFGEANIRYLLGEKAIPFYSALVVLCIFLGSGFKVNLVWALSDFFNGLMVIPNLIALIASAGLIAKLSKEADK